MDTRLYKLILGISLAMPVAPTAHGEAPKMQMVAPLPALVLPGKPEVPAMIATPAVPSDIPIVDKSPQPLSSVGIQKREVLVGKKGEPIPRLAVAAAPLNMMTAKLLIWVKPADRSYMADLRQSILDADAAGNIAERDRLFAIYQPWAEKYLNPDSPTWVPPDEQ